MHLWKLHTTSAVHSVLRYMDDDNLMFVREVGSKTYYYAKPISLTNLQLQESQ